MWTCPHSIIHSPYYLARPSPFSPISSFQKEMLQTNKQHNPDAKSDSPREAENNQCFLAVKAIESELGDGGFGGFR